MEQERKENMKLTLVMSYPMHLWRKLNRAKLRKPSWANRTQRRYTVRNLKRYLSLGD
jgi:hypothetical protein